LEDKKPKGSLPFRRIVLAASLLVGAVTLLAMVLIIAAPEQGYTTYEIGEHFDNIEVIHFAPKLHPYPYTYWLIGVSYQSLLVLLVFTIFLRRKELATAHLLFLVALIGVIIFKFISTAGDFSNWQLAARGYTPEGEQYVLFLETGFGPGRPVYLCRPTGWGENVRHFEVMATSGLDNHFVTNLVRPERIVEKREQGRLELAFSADRSLLVGLEGRECFLAWRFTDDPEKRNLMKDFKYTELSPFCLFGPDDTIHEPDLVFLKEYVAAPQSIYHDGFSGPFHPHIPALEKDRDSHPNPQVRQAAGELLDIIHTTHPDK
jgi:hypothetical protein